MKCPLFTMYAATYTEPDKYKDRECLKEKCAWWDEETNECSKLSEEKALRWISRSLQEIRLKMPHEAQFRK